MNLTQRPQPNTAFAALSAPSARRATLSARQLFDIELGLCLLASLSPSASPNALPALLLNDASAQTARQRRMLSRGRALLVQLTQPSRSDGTGALWADLLDRYARLSPDTQAFDISLDGSRFTAKSVGFFRNRVRTLNHLLA